MIKSFFKRLARSLGKFLQKTGEDLQKWGTETKKPKVPKKPKTIKKDLGEWYHIEQYITIVRRGEKGSFDAGYILFNVKEKDISEANTFLRRLNTFRIKDLLGLEKTQIIKEIHYGITESKQTYYYADVNGKQTTFNFNSFEEIKRWLK